MSEQRRRFIIFVVAALSLALVGVGATRTRLCSAPAGQSSTRSLSTIGVVPAVDADFSLDLACPPFGDVQRINVRLNLTGASGISEVHLHSTDAPEAPLLVLVKAKVPGELDGRLLQFVIDIPGRNDVRVVLCGQRALIDIHSASGQVVAATIYPQGTKC